MNIRGARLLVHPDFRKKLKVESAMNNMSIMEYTKNLSKKKIKLDLEDDDQRGEPKFGFRF